MSGDQQLQIRLVTDRADLSVPGTTLSVPSKIGPEGLTSLLRSLLAESCPDQDDLESKTFEFVLLSDLIRAPLEEFLSDKDSLSSESVLEISYFESRPAPKPQKSFSHDDWVSGLSCRGNFVLSACYDHTVNIFDVRTGEKKLTIPGTYSSNSRPPLIPC